jgi:acetyl-CoA synthetase
MQPAASQTLSEYLEHFDIDALRDELLTSSGQGHMGNAFDACIGRHLRAGQGERIALVHEDEHGKVRTLSYAELDLESARMATALAAQGVGPGERVACMLSRTPELLIALAATWRLGAIYQPLFTAFGTDALAYRLSRAETSVVITESGQRAKFRALASHPPIICVRGEGEALDEGDLDWQALMQSEPLAQPPVQLPSDAPFLQMFTSGTVGKPKGVAVALNALPAFWLYQRLAVDLRPGERFWNMADPGWAYGLYYGITAPLLLGATTYFMQAPFSAQGGLDFLQRHAIDNFAAAPTAYRMLKASGLGEGAFERLTLRVASSAGEPLNTEVVGWVARELGCTVMDHYGQTEVGMVCCNHHALAHEVVIGSVGFPLPGYRLAVLDAEYRELAPGEPGVLAVDIANSPAYFFSGYTWQEKQPCVEGYYLTGDVVVAEPDGRFTFAGRDDDIITTSGYRVGPADVENAILAHPAVAESAAVGKPDDLRGEIIKAYVVLRNGHVGDEALAEAIRSEVRQRLSGHSDPREISFVDSLPKTPSGKIQRFLLRAEAREE